jgi:SHS2 domain-containing protein
VELNCETFTGLFEDATDMVRHLLAGDSTVATTTQYRLSLSATGPDELLHHYVRELLVIFQVNTFVPTRLELDRLHSMGLVGRVYGEDFDALKHEPQPEVKAVTRHGLRVERIESGWKATMVLDM